MQTFKHRVRAALIGGAIGDAMGAPVEGRSSTYILKKFSDWDFERFLPPQGWDGVSHYWKGNGRITDDTLMIEAFMNAYIRAGKHMDSYDYAEFIISEVRDTVVWVTEYQREMPIWERLWVPEKFPLFRLVHNNAEPRSAGIGNLVNCGVAMWIMPAGAMNAGHPEAAYQEAAAIALAHNESFAIEAAACLAAAFAEAFAGVSIDSVLDMVQRLARDGTRVACAAAVEAVDPHDDLAEFIRKVREAYAPFDQRSGHTSDDAPFSPSDKKKGTDIGRPSRVKSIEEVPVALAALKYGNGDFLKTLRAAVCYGRDCDSIAGMACGLYGALFGSATFPPGLVQALEETNRRDFNALADAFVETVIGVHALDLEAFNRRKEIMRQST